MSTTFTFLSNVRVRYLSMLVFIKPYDSSIVAAVWLRIQNPDRLNDVKCKQLYKRNIQ